MRKAMGLSLSFILLFKLDFHDDSRDYFCDVLKSIESDP